MEELLPSTQIIFYFILFKHPVNYQHKEEEEEEDEDEECLFKLIKTDYKCDFLLCISYIVLSAVLFSSELRFFSSVALI